MCQTTQFLFISAGSQNETYKFKTVDEFEVSIEVKSHYFVAEITEKFRSPGEGSLDS
jgi:hypothetical protein